MNAENDPELTLSGRKKIQPPTVCGRFYFLLIMRTIGKSYILVATMTT